MQLGSRHACRQGLLADMDFIEVAEGGARECRSSGLRLLRDGHRLADVYSVDTDQIALRGRDAMVGQRGTALAGLPGKPRSRDRFA